MSPFRLSLFATLFATLAAGLFLLSGLASAATIDLRVLETTDIHTNVMDYDYYKDQPTSQFGLVRGGQSDQSGTGRGRQQRSGG